MNWTPEQLADWLRTFRKVYVFSDRDAASKHDRFDDAFSYALMLFKNVEAMTVDRAAALLLEPINQAHEPAWEEHELRKVVSMAHHWYTTGETPEGLPHDVFLAEDGGVGMYWFDSPRVEIVEPPPLERVVGDQSELSLAGNAVIQYVSSVKPESVAWLWPNRIALGKLTMVAGDPGLGKSFLTLDFAARVSSGINWPDGTEVVDGSVVLLSAEDDLGDTIRPRLDAAGADCGRIIAMKAIYQPTTDGGTDRQFSLERDIPSLEAAIAHTGECKLVVIDPITAYCGSTDSHKNAEIRALLAPLSELARKHQVAIVAVSHLNKGQGAAIYRTMGSLAFVAAARAAYVVAKDRSDPARRLFVPIKNNLGDDATGLAYRITDGRVEWEPGVIDVSADSALAVPGNGNGPAKPKTSEKLQEAMLSLEEWFTAEPAQKAIPAKDIVELASGAGINEHWLKKAKKQLGIKSERQGFGKDAKYVWTAPDSMFPTPTTSA